MKCHACEYFVSPDHCWVDPKTVDPCPEGRTCDKFKYEAGYGEIAQLEREKERARCAEICAEVRRTALRQTTGDMAHANGIAVGAEYCERKIRGDKC